MRGIKLFGTVVAALAIAVAGCGSSSDGGASDGGSASDMKVGIAYALGGRSDQSFGQAAGVGVDRAKRELGVSAKELEARPSETDAARAERLRLLARGGYNPIVAVGYDYAAAMRSVAREFPSTKFAIIDSTDVKAPNVANLTFAENEGSFLVGVAGALKSRSGKLGFIGGVNVPLIHRFEAGFRAGVRAIDPSATVQATYLTQPPDFSGFVDPAKGRTAAEGMYDNGADVVYQAAGGSGDGVFQAAAAAGKLAIGVDSDQWKSADPSVRHVILTSMTKRVDIAVYDFVKQVRDGRFQAGERVYDLKAGGVGAATSGGRIDDVQDRIDAYRQRIVDGSITVPRR